MWAKLSQLARLTAHIIHHICELAYGIGEAVVLSKEVTPVAAEGDAMQLIFPKVVVLRSVQAKSIIQKYSYRWKALTMFVSSISILNALIKHDFRVINKGLHIECTKQDNSIRWSTHTIMREDPRVLPFPANTVQDC